MANIEHSLDGWDISQTQDAEWIPWGSRGDATAKILAAADGYHVVLVEAEPGYTGDPHVHDHAEFLYVLSGSVRTQGHTMSPGDAYAAATGSSHTDFSSVDGARYVIVFRI